MSSLLLVNVVIQKGNWIAKSYHLLRLIRLPCLTLTIGRRRIGSVCSSHVPLKRHAWFLGEKGSVMTLPYPTCDKKLCNWIWNNEYIKPTSRWMKIPTYRCMDGNNYVLSWRKNVAYSNNYKLLWELGKIPMVNNRELVINLVTKGGWNVVDTPVKRRCWR